MEFLDECKANKRAWESIELARVQIQKGPGDIPGTILKKDLLQGIVLLQLEVTELKKTLQSQTKEVSGKDQEPSPEDETSQMESANANDVDQDGTKELINNVKKKDQKKTTEKEDICPKHLINQCPNPRGCKFDHPVRCFKIMHYGLKQFDDRGCDLSCNKVHPRMCHMDMKYGNCKNRSCRKRHLMKRGNQRQQENFPGKAKGSNPRKNWSREPTRQHPQQNPVKNDTEPPSTFLEMQKMMKDMMLIQQQMMQEFLRKRD